MVMWQYFYIPTRQYFVCDFYDFFIFIIIELPWVKPVIRQHRIRVPVTVTVFP